MSYLSRKEVRIIQNIIWERYHIAIYLVFLYFSGNLGKCSIQIKINGNFKDFQFFSLHSNPWPRSRWKESLSNWQLNCFYLIKYNSHTIFSFGTATARVHVNFFLSFVPVFMEHFLFGYIFILTFIFENILEWYIILY